MALTPWANRGTLGIGSANIVTVTNAKYIVTNIVLANKGAATATATVSIEGYVLCNAMAIAPSSTVTLDIKQPIIAGVGVTKYVSGLASAASTIDYHIAGVSYS